MWVRCLIFVQNSPFSDSGRHAGPFRRAALTNCCWHPRSFALPPERGTIRKMFTASERRSLWELSHASLDLIHSRRGSWPNGSAETCRRSPPDSRMRRGLVPEKQGRLRWKRNLHRLAPFSRVLTCELTP